MDIRIAENCGFCYGVKRAVNMANDTAEHTQKSYTLGPIIHNPQVVESLENNGVYAVNKLDDVPGGTVIIRSHGVGPAIYKEASERGLNVVDATCPHVKKAQQDAKSVIDAGKTLVILGEKKHPEVISINLWADNKGIIVETEEDAKILPFVENMGVVVQTTFSQFKFQSIIEILEKKLRILRFSKPFVQQLRNVKIPPLHWQRKLIS